MKQSFSTKLHRREIEDLAVRSKAFRSLYSDRRLINDLDIVNELDGHSGCVNALSWSKSGSLLASGSDDQHLNIHTYQPDASSSQFQLTATVATGHTQNIFSVKFMPHSNDRTVITAAGDAQVRVFDVEYAGQATSASAASTYASEGRRRGRNNVYNGVRYLSDGDTNARVYKSHADRVKRIVTESSPHLFLTCSEDGEVRQWDLRQPSSAYPEPRGNRLSSDSSVPPPLISYKRYNLDLNTISCSANQPHYIALGGAHLHAFLHDRRMTGRDKLKEMGKPLSPIDRMSAEEQDLLSQATQCVRKFAPQGQKRMKRADNGHITACKISDARPDEMVASWSGDHIYSFDLIRDPEPKEEREGLGPLKTRKAKESGDKKRKRKANGSEASLGQEGRASSRPRTESASQSSQDAALRVRYQNGQSEDIPLPRFLTEDQQMAQTMAKNTVKLRSALFGREQNSDPTSQFTTALGFAGSTLAEVDEAMRRWGYPMSPAPEQVYVQQTLRRHRERTRRFLQASGTLARVLGGKLRTTSGTAPIMAHFAAIEARRNDLEIPRGECFCYDFLKAVLLWLDSGIGRLIEGFTRPSDIPSTSKAASRLPIPEADATPEAIEEHLIPYLLSMAGDEPILDLEANEFLIEENRRLFSTEKAAVAAFAAAVKIPFDDLSSAIVVSDGEGAENIQAQDRQAAHRFWARKVARSILLRAAEGLNFATVDRAFGGIGRVIRELADDEILRDAGLEDEDVQEDLRDVEIIAEDGVVVDGFNAEDLRAAASEARAHTAVAQDDPDEGDDAAEVEVVIEEEEDEDIDDDDDDDALSDFSSEADEEDGVPNIGIPRYIYRPAFERRRLRPKVEANTPCSGPTRQYRGHCNVRTVKDVNYFGPNDEYVVSGSDDGNFFIWDKKTSELVNILEGDGEVVNVVQSHPYETMLAVSGIDHTIKIFSPDSRAREAARLGRGISAHDPSSFSSIAWPSRARHRARHRSSTENTSTSEPAMPEAADEDDEYVAPAGLSSKKRMYDSYRIIQNNNMEREGGNQEAVITLPHAQLLQLLFGQIGNIGF
ncbi:hypothetical protein M409DRAFT_29106 [Zasmidium cellare ATCC 36951]|uniref:Uncharacterized protein n=1 Tax=Zasmidium cellare ATCC 36951 TaxID=1080233 RepID=A0A6A6C0J2_ZASCE|nr:uncharacterized protein M409DRAFT_29106 [Zasmidium cellare ATCC 36951]KAF2160485.1 hypothetical protein M409DRAFT_29106 [Zasmidium cellare ATCC 36951]